ncbi:MAG: DUF3800 domain-containing protein [Methyloprofundus sp.]|nr:DUF3800 domain-containing protein [Methyloprofundus sp.]
MPKVFQIHELKKNFPKLRNCNAQLQFYYDETNNDRRLSLSEIGLNAASDRIFSLSGIALKPDQELLGWYELRKSIRIQDNNKDVKYRHIAPKEYEGALSDKRVIRVLEWMLEHNLIIHYSVLDTLHWATLDIIESLIGVERLNIAPFHLELKNELYNAVRHDVSGFMKILHRFQYPNISHTQVHNLINSILGFIHLHVPNDRNIATTMLKQTLQSATKISELELIFLHDNVAGDLIRDFSFEFMHSIMSFQNSTHIFDQESYIEKALSSFELYDQDRRLDYKFVNSRDEVGIQVSDIMTGLIGRHFTYLNNHTMQQLLSKKRDFSQTQLGTLELLRQLINKSDSFSDGLLHHILPLDTIFKNNTFLHEQQPMDYQLLNSN